MSFWLVSVTLKRYWNVIVKYMEFVVGRAPSYKEFVQNMNEKMQDDEFLTDVEPLLRHEVAFNPQEAYQFLYNKVIEKMIVPAT